jgi:hypothetical protein
MDLLFFPEASNLDFDYPVPYLIFPCMFLIKYRMKGKTMVVSLSLHLVR